MGFHAAYDCLSTFDHLGSTYTFHIHTHGVEETNIGPHEMIRKIVVAEKAGDEAHAVKKEVCIMLIS